MCTNRYCVINGSFKYSITIYLYTLMYNISHTLDTLLLLLLLILNTYFHMISFLLHVNFVYLSVAYLVALIVIFFY